MYAATTKDEGNAADGRFSASCWKSLAHVCGGKKILKLS